MSEPAIKNFDDLYFPDHYLIVRINPIFGLEKRSSWWTYDTHLAYEIDRVHSTFAKKLLRSGYIEFVQEQEHFNRTVFRKAKNAAQHHAHQTPETQATPQAVINAETLELSDSVPQSAQAQVA